MKVYQVLVLGGALLTSAIGSFGAEFTDIDEIDKKLDSSSNNNKSYTGTFNILNDNFVPSQWDVTSAKITFVVTDDSKKPEDTQSNNSNTDQSETVTITVQSEAITTGTQVGFNTTIAQASISGFLIAELQDGILSYTVTAVTGDFILKTATLVATASRVSVPDGGISLGLLGLGMLGVFGVSRRLAVK